MVRATSLAAALLLAVAPLRAQWPARAPADAPRTPDGEVNIDAPAPRTSDGRPDLSGTWRPGGGSYARGRPTGFSYPGRNVSETTGSMYIAPLFVFYRTTYGEAIYQARQATHGKDNPRGLCLPMGIVQLHTMALPARYIQTPRQLVILYEGNRERREIFTDGRPLPANDPQPWWNGYSVGRWDGDALVVETRHFRDGGWLDMAGNPLTDAGLITERFRRPSYGRMEIDITIEDKKAYTAPFTVRWNQRLASDTNLIESVCAENNRFVDRQR